VDEFSVPRKTQMKFSKASRDGISVVTDFSNLLQLLRPANP
jgi:hypothetical protein